MEKKRLMHLEGARGIASGIVILHHFTLAFYPNFRGPFWKGGIHFSPLYFLINGAGAVSFFFVLSGFVLTSGFYRRYSSDVLVSSVVKRLPRLMMPVGLSVLCGLVVLKFMGSAYLQAASLTGSSWLQEFGNSTAPPDFSPTLSGALKQILLVFLIPDNFYYNSNLWTMTGEFYGSMLVFGIVWLLQLRAFSTVKSVTALHVILALVLTFTTKAGLPFVLGSFLAYILNRKSGELDVSARTTWILLVVASIGFVTDRLVPNALASVLLMIVLLGNKRAASLLTNRMGEILGNLSFPLYLVHTLVIASVSSLIYVYLCSTRMPHAVTLLVTFFVTVVCSVIVSLPFMYLDMAWAPWISGKVRGLVEQISNARRQTISFPEGDGTS